MANKILAVQPLGPAQQPPAPLLGVAPVVPAVMSLRTPDGKCTHLVLSKEQQDRISVIQTTILGNCDPQSFIDIDEGVVYLGERAIINLHERHPNELAEL